MRKKLKIKFFFIFFVSLFCVCKLNANLIYMESLYPAATDQPLIGPYIEEGGSEIIESAEIPQIFTQNNIDTAIKIKLLELIWPPAEISGLPGPFVEGEEDTQTISYSQENFSAAA